MATKSQRKSTKKGRGRSKKKFNPVPWLVGAGIVLLIAVPSIIRYVQQQNLPGERFRSQGNLHISLSEEHVDYNSDPPTSGPHTPNLAGWRSYDYVVPDERLVHNMEDGGVILWYELGTPEENAEHIEALEEVARGYRRVVIAPREDMPTTYALTAWQRLQRFEEIDEEGMRAFLEAFEGIDHHPVR